MKKFMSLLFCLWMSAEAFSQIPNAIQCTYLLDYRPDSLNEARKQEKMQLIISGNKSYFESTYSFKADSISKSPLFDQHSLNLFAEYSKTNFTYRIIKTHNPVTITHYDKIGLSKFYEIEQASHTIDWKLGKLTKQIQGYVCREASTYFAGRNWQAWYTTDIPVSDGPYKFSGLPGLILEIRDSKNDYAFSLFSMKKLSTTEAPEIPTNAQKTQQTTFIKGRDAYDLQGVIKAANSGNTPDVAKKLIENYQLKQKNKNNHLELR